MALIGDIRKNSWLLIVLIGLGLASFIMMDMFSGDKSIFGAQQTQIGSINGKSIDWNEFQTAENVLFRGSAADAFSRRQGLWNYFVEESLLQEESKALGLSVGKEELLDLQFGANPSPIIQQSMRNPQTGQLDRAALQDYKSQIESNTMTGQLRQYWALQEKQIIKDRLQTKLGSMVTKGLYTPTWMVEQVYADQNQKMDFSYVKIPFDKIADADVKVEDSDLNNYLASNMGLYTQDEETRKVDYVTFNVLPTAQDSQAIKEELRALKKDFRQTTIEDMPDYVKTNFGLFNNTFYTQDQLSPTNGNRIFNAEVGKVIGPYVEGNTYSMAKVLDRRVLPDSASSRHILISATTPAQFIQADRTIDSLQNLIETGVAQFDSLAIKNSQDPGSASKGGKYDNVGINQFVPEYRDIIFFEGQIGKLYKVRTSYGVHLIEPLGRKNGSNKEYVRLAYLSQPIIPSETTQDDLFQEVYQFVNDNGSSIDALKAAAESRGMTVETSPLFKKNDYNLNTLGTGQAARDIVRWAYDSNTGTGDVSPELYRFQDQTTYHYNKYVVAALKSIAPVGKPTLANMREDIYPMVMNQKKAEMLKSTIGGQDLVSIASSYDKEIEEATNVSFSTNFLPGSGNEPKVVAAAANLAVNQISAPIAGDGGIYVVQLKNKPPVGAASNIPSLRKSSTAKIQSQVSASLMNSIKKNAEIEDNRSRFY